MDDPDVKISGFWRGLLAQLKPRVRNLSARNSKLEITFDFSLPLLFVLLAWALGFRYFPKVIYSAVVSDYVVFGIVASAGVVLSILFHEFGHAIAAKRCGLEIKRIHLYALGGMAELKHRPVKASDEAIIALAGPLFSVFAGGFFWMLYLLPISAAHQQIVHFLGFTNILLAFFNLIPVYPLDGGRLMRGILWHYQKTFMRASALTYRISAVLLALLSASAIVLVVSKSGIVTYWVGIWLFYLAYMTLRGKAELLRLPDFSQLIKQISPDENLYTVRAYLRSFPGLLEKSLVPVFIDRHFAGLLAGDHLNHENAGQFLVEPVNGCFIDLSQLETYQQHVDFKKEILPVFDENRYLGLADAHELRFWLLEGYHARIREHVKG